LLPRGTTQSIWLRYTNGQDLVLGQKTLNFALQFVEASVSFAPNPVRLREDK